MYIDDFCLIDESISFVLERDASDVTVSATLKKNGRPVAFISRTLSGSEVHYPAIEKEKATSVIEAVRKWSHLLSRRHFKNITEQKSVAFMMDNRKHYKITKYNVGDLNWHILIFCCGDTKIKMARKPMK